MTKAELIEEVAKLASLTKKETELIVNTIFDNITEALSKGDKVELRDSGASASASVTRGKAAIPRRATRSAYPKSGCPSSRWASGSASSSIPSGDYSRACVI